MVSNISPVSNYTPSTGNGSVAQQLEALIQEYRYYMDHGNSVQQMKVLEKMEQFLTQNSGTIMADCILNGYSEGGQDPGSHYVTFFDQALTTIQTLMQDFKANPDAPLPTDTLDMLNELFTQLGFLASNPNPQELKG